MTHFTDQELTRWREAGPGGDTGRLVAHLAECADCAARFATMVRTRPLAEPLTGNVRDFASAVSPRRRWVWVAVPLAAAAVLVLALALPRSRPPEPAATPAFRGAAIHALAPVGEAGRDSSFTWSSGLAAARYRIEVTGPDGAVYTTDVTGSPVRFGDDLLGRLTAGVSYSWTVTALDGEGRALGMSERRTFSLRPQ